MSSSYTNTTSTTETVLPDMNDYRWWAGHDHQSILPRLLETAVSLPACDSRGAGGTSTGDRLLSATFTYGPRGDEPEARKHGV